MWGYSKTLVNCYLLSEFLKAIYHPEKLKCLLIAINSSWWRQLSALAKRDSGYRIVYWPYNLITLTLKLNFTCSHLHQSSVIGSQHVSVCWWGVRPWRDLSHSDSHSISRNKLRKTLEMAPQTPQRHTSIIDLENDFSDGGSEYWPEGSNYVFKPNDDYYHRSLASQWMDSTGQSRKGTSPVLVFYKHTLIPYHLHQKVQ